MVYMGSKNKLAKYIVPILQKAIDDSGATYYIEPFVGGANIIDKIQCKNRIGCDINENLITLLNYVRDNPNLDIAPEDCSFEHYKDVRENQHTGKYSPEYVALIGYSASYGGRYFDGGYGRNGNKKPGKDRSIYKERIRNLKRQAPNLKDVKFICGDFNSFNVDKFENAVLYLDPPYKDTKNYSKQNIDYEKFYDFCERLAQKNMVFISEYNMPEDRFEVVWEKERTVTLTSNRETGTIYTEKLYKVKGGFYGN